MFTSFRIVFNYIFVEQELRKREKSSKNKNPHDRFSAIRARIKHQVFNQNRSEEKRGKKFRLKLKHAKAQQQLLCCEWHRNIQQQQKSLPETII
jgi:hypothetical protein